MHYLLHGPRRGCALLLLLLCSHVAIFSQSSHARDRSAAASDDDPAVILEVGAATGWDVAGGAATFAPNLAAEITPIEHWLELEAGVSPFYTRGTSEWDTDLLFKKPWTISPGAEFMFGAGPEWVRRSANGRTSNTLAVEVAGDFMFWPGGRHRFGWYVEPAYDYSFAAGHEQSLGMSAGLLIGLHRRH